jgi:hypothetical protein
MTPQERELHRYAEDVDKRAEHLMGVLRDALPQLDPVAVQRRAVIMAILERDARLMDRVEILVRLAEHVALVPGEEAAARRNMDKMLSAAKLTGASCVRNSRADFFYGGVLLFGYMVRLGSVEAEVEMPAVVGNCRLYIGGNSWMWKFAPGMLRTELGLDNPEEGDAL